MIGPSLLFILIKKFFSFDKIKPILCEIFAANDIPIFAYKFKKGAELSTFEAQFCCIQLLLRKSAASISVLYSLRFLSRD